VLWLVPTLTIWESRTWPLPVFITMMVPCATAQSAASPRMSKAAPHRRPELDARGFPANLVTM
jgi:hypothetical protein